MYIFNFINCAIDFPDENYLIFSLSAADIRAVQNEKNGTQPETSIPGTGAVGRTVHVRGGQRIDVHAADRVDVRHRQTVHRARVLDGVRHVARQVRVPHQPQRRRLSARAVPGAAAVLHGGHTTGHRHPVAHLHAPATHAIPSKRPVSDISIRYDEIHITAIDYKNNYTFCAVYNN